MINVIDAAGNVQNIGTLPDLGPTNVGNGLPIAGVSNNLAGDISAANANYLTTTIATTPAPTTNSSLEITTTGYNNLVIQVSNTTVGTAFTGTLQVQGTVDGTNWITLGSSRLQTYAGTIVTTGITGSGIFIADVTGLQKARVTSTTATFSNSARVFLEVTSSSGLPAILGAVSAVSTVSVVSAANLNIPGLVADAGTSAVPVAISATATTSAITPSYGCSYEVNIYVSAVGGTNSIMDVIIQESDDNGVTTGSWFDVYHFERITAAGTYRSPKLPLTGTRIRYVQTLGGTSPVFTRAINRLQSSDTGVPIRRYFDRTINITGLNSTPSYSMGNPSKNVQLIVSSGTLTTAPIFKLEGSEDSGASWYDLSASRLTAVTGDTVHLTLNNVRSQLVRATVTTVGAGTLNYLCIKAYD
jgi:hypothetical protein